MHGPSKRDLHLAHDGVLLFLFVSQGSIDTRDKQWAATHFEVGKSNALGVMLLGEKEVPEAELLGLGLEFLHYGRDRRPASLLVGNLVVIEPLGGKALILE